MLLAAVCAARHVPGRAGHWRPEAPGEDALENGVAKAGWPQGVRLAASDVTGGPESDAVYR